MISRDIQNRFIGAVAVVLVWAIIKVIYSFDTPFNSERWHDPATSDDDIHAMMPDLMNNVLRSGKTPVPDVVRLLGPPTDRFEDSLLYGLPQRASAFDATYLIIKINAANVVTDSLIVDH